MKFYFRSIPNKVWLLIFFLYVLPPIMDMSFKTDLFWILYFIPAYFFAYFFGISGGVITGLFSSFIHFFWEWGEYLHGENHHLGFFFPIELSIMELGISICIGYLASRMKQTEQSYKKIVDHASVGIWSIDLQTGQVTGSKGIENIYERPIKQFEQDPGLWFEVIYPDDQDLVKESVSTAKAGEPTNIEYRIMTPNGNIRYVSIQINPIADNRGNVKMLTGVVNDITELKAAEEKVKYMTFLDELTGLPNRKGFRSNFEQMKGRIPSNQEMAILFLDLDQFKVVNNSLGNQIGDALLVEVAKRIQSSIGTQEIVARQGGDEYLILLCGTFENILRTTHQMVLLLNQVFPLQGHDIYITASIGISHYPRHGKSINQLIGQADLAMHEAKGLGKNRIVYYSSEMDENNSRRLTLVQGLRRAIENQEFELFYQPKVHIESRKIIGVEALIRWRHPEFGMVSPAEFIPLAEETGLINPIGEWVLRTACWQNKTWQEKGYPRIKVSVNISPRQFSQENLVQMVEAILKETQLDPHYLDLEITEGTAATHLTKAIMKLNELKALGVGISLDDFGTGYSSLNYLYRFPIDELKIDQSFLRNSNHTSQHLIEAIITVAKKLNLTVITEGVETEEHLEFLQSKKCDFAQGYYFSRPLPEKEVQDIIRVGSFLTVKSS